MYGNVGVLQGLGKREQQYMHQDMVKAMQPRALQITDGTRSRQVKDDRWKMTGVLLLFLKETRARQTKREFLNVA